MSKSTLTTEFTGELKPKGSRGIITLALYTLIGGMSLLGFGGWGIVQVMVFGIAPKSPTTLGAYWFIFVGGLMVICSAWGFWLRKPWARVALIIVYALGLIAKVRPDFPIQFYFHFVYFNIRLGSFEIDILNVLLYAYLLHFLACPAVKAQFHGTTR